LAGRYGALQAIWPTTPDLPSHVCGKSGSCQ
jgi:hypothetical protein